MYKENIKNKRIVNIYRCRLSLRALSFSTKNDFFFKYMFLLPLDLTMYVL